MSSAPPVDRRSGRGVARFVGPAIAVVAVAVSALGGCSSVLGVDFGGVHLKADGVDASAPKTDAATTHDGALPDGAEGGAGCVAKTCAQLGATCGTQNDGCGGAVTCGTCTGTQVCSGLSCKCAPTTCPALGAVCGTQNDGCGGALDCGKCTGAAQACVGGQCVCQPQTCAEQNAECGTVPDGCGGTYTCQLPDGGGACPAATPNCTAGVCTPTPCTPRDCTGLCGSASDGCGNVLSCPGCTAPATCGGTGTANVCGCSPTTCAAKGANCGSIPDGCGNMLDCGTCAAPESCDGAGTANVCGCTPTTCAALGKNCGAVADGCGGTLSCGTCSGDNTCAGGGVANVCGCTSVLLDCDNCCGAGTDNCGRACTGHTCCVPPCFTAGTHVTMADGSSKPIEDVKVGDLVASWDPEAHAMTTAHVTATPHHEASDVRIIVVNGVLHTTENHPFAIEGRPVRADELRVGDPLIAVDLGPNRLAARADRVTSIESLPGGVETFDLVVDGPEDFFVEGYLVLVKEDPP